MPFFYRPIRFRYTLALCLGWSILLLGALGVVKIRLDQEQRMDFESHVLNTSRHLQEQLNSKTFLQKKQAELGSWAHSLGQIHRIRIVLLDENGLVLADSDQHLTVSGQISLTHLEEVRQALKGRRFIPGKLPGSAPEKVVHAAFPIILDDHVAGVMRLSFNRDSFSSRLRDIVPILFAAWLLGLVFCFGIGKFWGKELQERIASFTDAARQFSKGNLDRSLLQAEDDEFDVLVKTLVQTAVYLESRITQIEKEKAKLALVLENMSEGVIATDAHQKIIMMNPKARTIFGLEKQSAEGKSLIETTFLTALDELAEKALQEQTPVNLEVTLSHPETRILKAAAVPIRNAPKKEIGLILVIHDITPLRKLENTRREFVANVSHELKTPLTSILGFIETLLGGAVNDPGPREEFLKIMLDDAKRLQRLIDDLLEISKLESRDKRIQKSPVPLTPLIHQTLKMLHAQIQQKSLSVQTELPAEDLCILGEEDKLKQVLINLLDNAVKFNPHGGTIRIFTEPAGAFIRISVQDTGPGIPPEAVPRIFERFFRVDKARSRELGGTGLGLSIVKHIIEAHDGQVFCNSSVGQGSTFSFTLPLA